MSAFALIPIALAASWLGLRRGHPAALGAAALFSALVVSNNFYGATALATFFPVLVWAIFIEERDGVVWLRAAAIAALAYGLTAFWLTPSYFRVTVENMKLVANPGNAWSVWLAAVTAAAFGVMTWRLMPPAWVTFVSGSLLFFMLNVAGQRFFNFRISGEPERLVPELDLCIILALVAVSMWLWRGAIWRKAIVLLILYAWVVTAKGWVRRSHQLVEIDNNYKARIEYKIQDWVARNLPGARVLANGSVRFWYNAWNDLPQVGGGSEQGTLNIYSTHAYYGAAVNVPVEQSVAWLQAVGAGAITVHDQTSEEIYHDIENPARFAKLKAFYEDGKGNFVYEIPRRFPDLARVVDGTRIRGFGKIEASPIEAYTALVEQGPDRRATAVPRTDPKRIGVRVQLEPGDAVLVQETYDPAWRATSGGRELAVSRDPIGFMLLDPGPGSHEIELRFETPLENRIGRGVTIGSILVLIWLLAGRSCSSARGSSR